MGALLVSTRTGEALKGFLRRHESRDPDNRKSDEVDRLTVFVKCTSTTPAGGGVGAECYPAVIVDLDSSQLVSAQPTLGNVWLTLISAGAVAAPTVNTIYEAQLSGEFNPGSDNRPRVFAVAGPASFAQSTLNGTYTITGATAWEDTGPELTVPGAGTYLFFTTARSTALLSAGSGEQVIVTRIWDQTNSAEVFGTAVVVNPIRLIGVTVGGSCSAQVITVVAGAYTYRLQASRSTAGSPTWTSSAVFNLVLGYLRLA